MTVFEVVDKTSIEAAEETFHTFSELVRFLVSKFSSDLDKVRSIFRWVVII